MGGREDEIPSLFMNPNDHVSLAAFPLLRPCLFLSFLKKDSFVFFCCFLFYS